MTVDAGALNELGKKCTHDDAPFCVATCPLHVDSKGVAAVVAAGDFAAARALLEAKSVLAGVLAYLCEAPCMGKCGRGALDAPVQIPLLERACFEHAPPSPIVAPPRKKQRVAVVGSGISGLTVALTLLKSGYSVSVYDAQDELGGRLRGQGKRLPAKVLEQTLSALYAYGAEIISRSRIGTEVPLEQLTQQFDAVCLACGRNGITLTDTIDPFTLRAGQRRLFTTGSLAFPSISDAPSRLAESGRRAAVSITRLLQQVSLSANRTHEGAYDSALHTNLDGREIIPAILPADGESFTRTEAVAEAARCLRCRCEKCMKGCALLREFDKYAGICVKAVVKNITIVSGWGGKHTMNDFINSCDLCGRCKEICPSDVDMGYANAQARCYLWEQGTMPPALHDFPLRDLEFSRGEGALARHQQDFETSQYLFFTGCQLPASMPETVKRTYDFLTKNLEGGVGLLINCCGTPADWAGRKELAEETRTQFVDTWETMGRPSLIVACPGCYKVLRKELPEIPLLSLSETLEGLLPEVGSDSEIFAYHDPCTTRNFPEIQDSDRAFAWKLGASLYELPDNRTQTQCCGYGGLQYHINPPLTDKSVSERSAQSSLPYLTSCSNCRDFFHSTSKDCVHLLELAFGREPAKLGGIPMDFTERRERRRKLRGELIARFWKEEIAVEAEKFPLMISPALREKMNDQCILEEDVHTAIEQAEQSGRRMYTSSTGWYSAGYRRKIITYWVEYTMEDGQFILQNCYSHRMRVLSKHL